MKPVRLTPVEKEFQNTWHLAELVFFKISLKEEYCWQRGKKRTMHYWQIYYQNLRSSYTHAISKFCRVDDLKIWNLSYKISLQSMSGIKAARWFLKFKIIPHFHINTAVSSPWVTNNHFNSLNAMHYFSQIT